MCRCLKKKYNNLKSIDYNEIYRFYTMLLRYKQNHPSFSYKTVILKLYPQIDWELLEINEHTKI